MGLFDNYFPADFLFIIDEDEPRKPPKRRNPPLKLQMLLHFYGCAQAFAPEATRTSPVYVQFVKELLREGLIERPTHEERAEYPGWAYRTTPKGDVMVNAICSVPTPVERTRWVMPQ